jgi:hypothetical protein
MKALLGVLLAAVAAVVGLAVPSSAEDVVAVTFAPDGHECYTTTPFAAGAARDGGSCPSRVITTTLPVSDPPVLVPAPVTFTVHYRTIAQDRPPVGYVPVQDGLLTIQRGSTGTDAVVRLLPSQLPEERFVLELFAPSFGTLVNPKVTVTIKRRG